MENFTQILEAILFASGTPRRRSEILEALTDKVNKRQFDNAIEELQGKYHADSGIVLVTFNDKLQLTTNTKYGETVAEVLTPLKEKELSKVLLEVLAIIAYKQPITRLEIERVKTSSAEYAISVLMKTNLVEIVGRKDAVGRPVLYGTTEEFLKKFQLTTLEELPDFEAVLARLESLGEFHKSQIELYRDVVDIDDASMENTAERLAEIERSLDPEAELNRIMDDDDELPDFLDGENYQVIE